MVVVMALVILGGSRLLPLAAVCRRASEKICRFDAAGPGETFNHIDGGRIDASLKRADIGAVELGAMRQLFLRQASGSTKLSQIEREYLSNIHDGEGSALKSILPRSILYNHAPLQTWPNRSGRLINSEAQKFCRPLGKPVRKSFKGG